LNLPPQLLEYLKDIISEMEDGLSCEHEMMNQFARLLVLVFEFAEWSQSDHPHRHFIFECVSWMKETGRAKHRGLARLLDLQKFQSKRLWGFCRLFNNFRKFAQPSMVCSEPTERTLLCFFEQMHMVFSNEPFLTEIHEFLETLEKERLSCEAENSGNPRFKRYFSWSAKSIFHQFLEDLVRSPQLRHMIEGISYFRLTNCADCCEFLDHDNDDGLCEDCAYQRGIDDQIDMYEKQEQEQRRYGRHF
jgi:hypothetical protein